MIAKHGKWEVKIEQIKQEVIYIRLFQIFCRCYNIFFCYLALFRQAIRSSHVQDISKKRLKWYGGEATQNIL